MGRWLHLAAAIALSASAAAELQNVTIGGEIRIRPRYWHNVYANDINGPQQIRIPSGFLPARAIGPWGANSRYRFDDRGSDLDFVEQRNRLHIDADFTGEVGAFIELETYYRWGTDFRSDYRTGADAFGGGPSDVQLYQAYIEADDMYGHPLRLRIGRQEMKLGKGWLVDDISAAIFGRSFDMARLTYSLDAAVIDAWYGKLAENGAIEEDGDIDFYGVHGTYSGIEALSLSAYWMLIRDGRSINDTNFTAPIEWLEGVFGLDDYDPSYMHTVGLRAFGKSGAVDYDLELAYQFGDADHVGALFSAFGTYGDNDADFGAWAGDLELGYAFDTRFAPRVYIGGAYFQGEDNRSTGFVDWISPFDRSDASVSFNRLFPGTPYSPVLEIGQDMSNFWQVRAGVNLAVTDAVTLGFKVAYYGVVEPFDLPRSISLGRYRVPVAPALSFWTQEADDALGWTAAAQLRYAYTEDLSIGLLWEHFFPGDGASDGSFAHRYGLEFTGGSDDDDADYIHADIRIMF